MMGRLATSDGWHGASWRMEMTLLTLLIFIPLAVMTQTVVPQELEFVVLSTSVASEQNKERLGARNPYVLVGTSMRMLCRYRVSSEGRDYCAEKKSTNLIAYPKGRVARIKGDVIRDKLVVIDNTNKCNLTVEFRNVTTDMEGLYVCEDEEAHLSDQRTIEIGEAPVKPMNISVVYRPLKDIALNLDPVKTGRDLSARGTTWTVEHLWRTWMPYEVCRKKPKKCNSLRNGLCEPCVIKLKNYAGYGQYTDFGSLIDDITFRINVSNIFGSVIVKKTFNLLNWVQPSAIELSLAGKNESSLKVAVKPHLDLDQEHYDLMKDHQHPMMLRWSVDLVSAKNQILQLQEGREFEEKYGFLRNLEDDLAALDPKVVAAFPKSSGEIPWTKNDVQPQLVISGLPFPGYHHDVSVHSVARYAGEKTHLNVSLAYTQEAAPQEGPGLHESFAYCENSTVTAKACVVCVLYFKEIPRSKRGSAVVNYTVTLKLLNGDRLQHKEERCTEDTTRLAKAQGQDNSVLICELEAGGEYAVSFQAHNDVGSSPISTRILQVHATPPPTTPQNIVLEKTYSSSLWMYDLYWAPMQSGHQDQVQYFVHYCNATSLQMQGRTDNSSGQSLEAADKTLNCVTNIVSTRVNDTSTFSFDQPPRERGPMAAFFVSTVTSAGVSSGLQKVGCFYTRKIFPEKVKELWVQKAWKNALQVVFTLPCGTDLNYKHGRPEYYAVGVVKLSDSVESRDACKQSCGSLIQKNNNKPMALLPQDNLQESVRIEQRDLEPDTVYCVGVNLAERSRQFKESNWQCTVAKTAELPIDQTLKIVLSSIAVIVVVIITISLVYCWHHTRKQKEKFRLKQSDLGVPLSLMESGKTKLPNGQALEGMESGLQASSNPTHCYRGNDSETAPSNDSGIDSSMLTTDSVDRYPQVGISDERYPRLLPIRAESDVENYDDFKQPLISGSSGHPEALQHSGLNSQPTFSAFSASSVECRPLLCGNDAYGENEREPSSSVDDDEEDDGENASGLDLVTCSEEPQNIDTRSTPNMLSSDLTCHQPSRPSLFSRNRLHNQPDTPVLPETHTRNPVLQVDQSSVCTPAMPCSVAESQTLGHGNSDAQAAGQHVPQQTNMIGQYSIDDILRAAGNSSSVAIQPLGVAELEAAEPSGSEPLLLENILRAADMCPWKGSADVHAGMVFPRGAGAADNRNLDAHRDSACFSSIGTESAKETDGESESLTGNS